MSSPTRYPNGVTNVGPRDPMKMLKVPDPTLMHVFYDDFDRYVAGDWTITAVGTGTSALGDADGGALVVTTSALENDGRQHQKVGESFLLASGKQAMFKAKFKLDDATQSDILIGLAVTDTTLIVAAGDGVTDGIFFQKDDGVATLDFYCQKDTTTGQLSTTSVATLADGIYVTAAWYYDGVSSVEYYINGVHKGTLALTSTPSAYLPDTELTVSFAVLAGAAAAKALTLDYILAALER